MDYSIERESWSWPRAQQQLLGTLPAGFNMASIAVDRHVSAGAGERPAFIAHTLDGARRVVSYSELATLTNRVANALDTLGIEQGGRVFTLLGRRLELYLTALATLRAGAVYCPLFSSFGPEPVRARMQLGEAQVLVTDALLYQRKIAPILDDLERLEHVIIVGETEAGLPDATLSFDALVDAASAEFEPAATDAQSPALLHFTSGTTGTPKGALHVHEAIVAHHATARLALGVEPGDVYWCTADPGWVTGISYGLLAPLSVGATVLIDAQEFAADRWYDLLERERVAVWYTAPTAIRMMRRLGTEEPRSRQYPHLRHLASVGEPLEAESVDWGLEAFGVRFHDTWWQTETGAIMIGNFPASEVRPGSMGRPFPGIEAATVRRTGTGIEIIDDPAEVGELAIRQGWPSMFRDYVGEPTRYRETFADGWYLSGDLVRRDEDGYYWFVGRVDDAIQSAGHLIGPFEIERVMMEHPGVADVAAVGKPDPIAFEIVTASIVAAPGYEADDELRRALLAHARRRLGPAVAPREIVFYSELPKTPSGKTRRRVLREALGS